MDQKTIDTLKAIGVVAEGSYFNTVKAMKSLSDQGLVEGNPAMVNPADKNQIAYRLTDKAKAEISGDDEADDVDKFVIADVAVPPVSRVNSGASKYPFDKLNPGQAFFIPTTADMKSPSKSFGSMVSANNKKYGKQTDFRRFTTRAVMGDAWGKPGVKGIGIYRLDAIAEAEAKAKANAPAA